MAPSPLFQRGYCNAGILASCEERGIGRVRRMISRRVFSWYSSAVLCAVSLAATSAALTFAVPAAHAQTTVSFVETDGLSFEVKEGDVVVLTVTVSSVPATSLNVSYSIGGDNDPDTADADASDYSDLSSGVVTVAAGEATAQLILSIIDDDEIEPTSESFTVSLTPGAGYTLTSSPMVRVVIKEGVCDRTPQVQDGILRLINGVSNCADVTDGHLSGVEGALDLRFREISTLSAGDFSGLGNLSQLSLWGNQLSALPESVFSGLGNLEFLDIRSNRLSTLPESVFSGLGNLRTLYLFGNQLSVLSANVFSGLGKLELLDLDRNQLATLPENVFSDLVNLRTLYLFRNQLSALPATAFSGLGRLRQLYLFENQLSTLPESVFSSLVNLEWLDLSSNRLSTLPATVFSNLVNLESLDIRSNRLIILPESVFSGLGNLERLDLDSNRLVTLPATVFSNLISLEFLDIHSNRLSTLPESVFSGPVNLKTLILWDNQLTALPANVFSGLDNLEWLDLDGNQLTTLPTDVFSGLVNLELLDLSSNRLTTLPATVFSNLISLGFLDIRSNRLNTLPEGIFSDLVNLGQLLLIRNPGAPFAFSRSQLVYIGETDPPMLGVAEVKLVVDEMALTTIVTALSVEGGRPSVSEVLIPKGSTESSPFTVTQIASAPMRLRTSSGRLVIYFGIETEPSEELVLDFIGPSVSDVEIVSKPVVGDAYLASFGEVIRVAVSFDEAVEVSTSISGPSLTLTVGKTTRVATYAPSLSEASALVFAYELQSGDADGDGISVEEDALVLAGAEIADVAGFPLQSTSLESHVVLDAAGHRVIEDDFRLSFDAADGLVFEVEEGDVVALAVTVNSTINTGVIINYSITTDGDPNTADADASDYSVPGVVTIAAGETAAEIVLSIIDDDKIEPTRESFTVSLVAIPGYALVSPTMVRVVIKEGVCDRTWQVRNGILRAIGGVSDCSDVTDDGLSGVTGILDLRNGGIAAISAGDFSGLGNLRELYLTNNQLSTLPANAFSDLGNLRGLYLHDNRLSTLTATVFSGLDDLRLLYLHNNRLSALTATVFSGLGNLQQLYLHNNRLSALTATVFSGLGNLQQLYLHNNRLSNLDGDRVFRSRQLAAIVPP